MITSESIRARVRHLVIARRLLSELRSLAPKYREDAQSLEALIAMCEDSAPGSAEIDCPLCGATVKQVASATLSLALWQHVNWTCEKRAAPTVGAAPVPVAGEDAGGRTGAENMSNWQP